MNYRHAYHAGNVADVLKHAMLALVVEHMKRKPAPFRVIDTHAGAGLYDLSRESAKTGEWRHGIGRLLAADVPAAPAEMLAPYLAAVRAENPAGGARFYPGSPVIARRLMRPGDRLVANELHPEDRERLAACFRRDPATKVLGLDGWTALKSLLPPKERRGLVLIDPPFEVPGEFTLIARGLRDAMARFATGTYIVWYPLKDLAAVSGLHRDMAALGLSNLLLAELTVSTARPDGGLAGSGLLVLNPPFKLCDQLGILLPSLRSVVARDGSASHRLAWLEPSPPSSAESAPVRYRGATRAPKKR